ncbi:MAG: phosphatidylglycerophosphatase A [Candidatus Omnitrophica bacterium]|nr:phosphatidylglycerophosphatase A [Candidatus Omnitrophota bacterium]MBU1923900.1 phosphatidylglycerophosphatase A [Candidatus Omnitrophota bacterium]
MKFVTFRNLLVQTISTFLFVGYLPLIPGTFGSIAGVGIFYLLNRSSWFGYFLFVFCIMLLGLLTSGREEKLLNKKDPGCIVIDEIVGMLIALSFLPSDPKIIILAFFMFRILDTLKPFPAGRLQNMHGAIGVMGDDLVAGVYANIVLQVILRLNY